MRRTILVTGASGFIGGRLAQLLAADGHMVRAVVRATARAGHLEGTANLDVVAGALEPDALRRVLADVDVVFHCAGNVRPWGRWADYERDNILATRALVQACAGHAPRLRRVVHLSTVDVYGYPRQPASEHTPVRLDTFSYGRSKAMGEAEIRRLEAHRIAFTIIRPCNVFGPRGQFVGEVGDRLQSRLMMTVNGGRAHAGLVYVDNLAANIMRAAWSEAAIGETFNLRDDYDVSWRQYLDRLAGGIGVPPCALNLPYGFAWGLATALEAPYRLLPIGAEPPLHRLLVLMFSRTCGHSFEKARRAFGARTEVSFDAAMAHSLEWYRRRRNK